ncbi:MAG: thioredoxin family protein [Bacteroidales bacterium]
MNKLKLSTRTKQALPIVFMVLSVLFLILLYANKDNLTNFASKAVQAQAGSDIQKSGLAFVDSAYNYTKNGLSYQVTFLEFGAKGCSACKRMETVMSEIRVKYPSRVNVVFINIMIPENQRLMKYFGIAVIPTQVLLNKEGEEYFRHTGYFSVEELAPALAEELK